MAAEPSMPLVNLASPPTILPSIKQEPLHPPLSPPPDPLQPPPPLAVVKAEPEPEPTQQQQGQGQEEEENEPKFLKSINELSTLSSAIDAFKCRFDELTKHLDSINQAIDAKLTQQQQEQQQQTETETEIETDNLTEKSAPAPPPTTKKPSLSEIESLCETMCSKGLRKYIVTHLSNVSKLREEVPAALKLARKPAKLVLDCIGRFFLQGVKAFTKDSPMIPARQASVLVLEFFLMMIAEVNIAPDVKLEAEKGAVAWRKRLITEGGLAKASEVDARGLLLYVACFGIPTVFQSDELGNLLRLCNLRAISDALKRSPVLPAKLPDIIEGMAKSGMYVEAVDVASIFGLEDKYSPKAILNLFLQETTKEYKRARQEAQNSPAALRRANEKQLDALKSIVHYLEDRSCDVSSDVSKLLGTWQIEEKIVKLEEEMAELKKRIEDKKVMPKRKLDEMGPSSKVKSQEMKRSRYAAKGSPLLKSSHVNGLHEQRTATLVDGIRSYDGLVANSLDSAVSGHVRNYPAASSMPHPHGSTVGSYRENGIGQMAGIGGVGSSSTGTGIGFLSASAYSGAIGDIGVDNAAQIMSSGSLPYGWHQGSAGQSASMKFGGLFGSSPSRDGFIGVPDMPSSAATERKTADLYRFADSVGENEFYSSSSHRYGTMPPAHHHSSYMYQ